LPGVAREIAGPGAAVSLCLEIDVVSKAHVLGADEVLFHFTDGKRCRASN
jgi:hypothetical protein